MAMDKGSRKEIHSRTSSALEDRKQLLELLINFQEQTNILLEEVINDNRSLKTDSLKFRDIIVKYEVLQKEIEQCVAERKECQKNLGNKVEILDNSIISNFERNRDYIVKEIQEMSKIVTAIRIEAAKEGAKYGVITSVATFITITVITFIIHWAEKIAIKP